MSEQGQKEPDKPERVSLWHGFQLDAGESLERNPVELFGSPVVDRIFAGTSSWHWRQLAWPALGGIGFLLSGVCLHAAFVSGNSLLATFGGFAAPVAFMAAYHFWNDHRVLPASTLHALATTPEQHRWLERLDAWLGHLIAGEVKVYPGDAAEPLDGRYFARNNGRVVVLDSCYGDTTRGRSYRKSRFRWSIIEPPMIDAVANQGPRQADDTVDATETDSGGIEIPLSGATESACAAPLQEPVSQESEAPSDMQAEPAQVQAEDSQALEARGPRRQPHHLHGLKKREFEAMLKEFLATKSWDKDRKDEFAMIQRAVFELVRYDAHPHLGRLVENVRKMVLEKHKTKLTLEDDSIIKMIGNSETHPNSEFRRFVLAARSRPNE